MTPRFVFVLCLTSTLFMTGVIWFVQVVHYPLMGRIGLDDFPAYHAEHTRRTGQVVFVPMLIELVTAIWLVFGERPRGFGFKMAAFGLLLAVVTWGITFFQSVPAHNRLSLGFDAATHRTLVATNLTRAFAWTGHALVLVIATYRQID